MKRTRCSEKAKTKRKKVVPKVVRRVHEQKKDVILGLVATLRKKQEKPEVIEGRKAPVGLPRSKKSSHEPTQGEQSAKKIREKKMRALRGQRD